MKFRTSFVTNSSSSSFVCDICGNSEGGYDVGLSDVGMMACEHGHTFCEYHSDTELTKEEKIKYMLESAYTEYLGYDKENKKSIERLYTEDEFFAMSEGKIDDIFNPEGYYDIPPILCPICSMTSYEDSDILNYLLKLNNTTASQIMNEVRETFGTYDRWMEYLKS